MPDITVDTARPIARRFHHIISTTGSWYHNEVLLCTHDLLATHPMAVHYLR
jgi:hypothetical protein